MATKYIDLDFTMAKLSTGDVSTVSDEDAINQSLYSLFHTLKGSRVNNLTYGTNIMRLIFDPFDQTTANLIVEEIKFSIQSFENNRVQLISININLDENSTTYIVAIKYSIKSTLDTGTFNFNLRAVV